MNSFAVIAFVACVAAANASWVHGPAAVVLQGPSSKTTLVGPEGSVITAKAPGGQIVHEEHPGVVAHAAPVLAHATPVVAHAHHAPATVVAHSSAYEHDSVLVAGPSGSISTGHAVHSAPVVAHAAPVVAHVAPVVAHAAPVVAHAAPVWSHAATVIAHGVPDVYGHEGQYVHDHSESLYDDGSYKPHLYHH